MATYKKPSISVFGLTIMNQGFNGDGVVFEALKAHKTIEIKGDENTVLVPFHAVREYDKYAFTQDTEAKDAYCE